MKKYDSIVFDNKISNGHLPFFSFNTIEGLHDYSNQKLFYFLNNDKLEMKNESKKQRPS
jgi:hypothetical protein